MGIEGSAAANDALVRAFMGAWERRDTGFILECLAEDAVYQSVPLSPIEGKGAVAAWVRGFTGKPPGRLEVRHQVASGDVVMNERTDSITLNGRRVTLPICAVFEMRNGASRPGASISISRRRGQRTKAPRSGFPGCLRWRAWPTTRTSLGGSGRWSPPSAN